ncbi:SgcJ/EcaC family oxidoreductase [Massilia eurypsychrophila]|nr:SgcJ/EcaC family oxidoreductase [Massilia eurypsychrophila]
MEIPEPLRELVDDWDAGRAAGDGMRLALLYAEDASVLLPTGQTLRGRDAIAAYYSKLPAVKERDRRRIGPRKFFFFPPVVHATATASGRHGEKHSFLDILVQQSDGSFLFSFSSWTLR